MASLPYARMTDMRNPVPMPMPTRVVAVLGEQGAVHAAEPVRDCDARASRRRARL
jgi:hypothetical protein